MDGQAGATALAPRPSGVGAATWVPVGMLGLGSFAIGTATFVVAGVLGGLAADLGVSVGAAGLTVTAFAVSCGIGGPVLSALLGVRPPRPVLVGALVVFGAANVVAAVAPSLPVLVGARVLSALAAGVYVPAAGAAAVAAMPAEQRGRALAVVLGGASASMVLGAPIGVLLAAASSWRMAFGFVVVLCAVAVAGLLAVRVHAGPIPRTSLRARLRPLRSRALAGSLAVTLLLMAGSNTAYTYLGPLLGPVAGPVGIGLLIGMFGFGGLLGTWYGGAAADRWGSARTAAAAVSVLTTALVLLPLAVSALGTALAVVLVWGLAAFAFVPAQQHRLLGLGDASAPLVLALNSSAINLGFAAGALLGGVVVDAGGVGKLWVVAAACCGGALVLHQALTYWRRS
ncbi:MFS transporter [Pseudonocardia aurantiaca]|uniref:MFS transporter n=1 Tax=Pseudonocardia aurantiaca TaxID=75290 RepID=A0ABW4FJ96_9PSEU